MKRGKSDLCYRSPGAGAHCSYFFPLSEKAEKLFEKGMKMEIMNQIMETLWNDREFREFFLKKVREVEILA